MRKDQQPRRPLGYKCRVLIFCDSESRINPAMWIALICNALLRYLWHFALGLKPSAKKPKLENLKHQAGPEPSPNLEP